MTAAGHIAVGMLIDQYCPPELAFGAGMLGHAAMDYLLPEFRGWPIKQHWPWWLWQAAGSIALLCRGWPWATWAIIGSVLPDLVDGAYSLLRPEAWQSGRLLCPWHRAGAEIFGRDMSWPLTFAVEALLIYLALGR